jgi:hypothetical protein
MQRKIIPVTILLMILAIFSLPLHSNEYSGKSIQQPALIHNVKVLPMAEPGEAAIDFTDSPTTILLSL